MAKKTTSATHQLVGLLLLLLGACQSSTEKPPLQVFNTNNLPTQTFLVNTKKDTILYSTSKLEIKIPKDAFVDSLGQVISGEVNIFLKEAFTLSDMIIGGLTTTTPDGKILESEGMFYLNATTATNQAVFIKKGISLAITAPANGLNTNIQHFTGEVTANNQIKWTNPVPLANAAVLKGIDNGKELFSKHCTQCHAIDSVLVGTALYNSHKLVSFKWFSNFTRYPQKTIESGDKRGLVLYNTYKQFMPNYDFLTDKELKDIWNYIKNESALLDKDPDRKKPLLFTKKMVDSLYILYAQNRQSQQQAILNQSKIPVEYDTIFDAGSTLLASTFGWFNYDYFMKIGTYTPINFSVTLDTEYDVNTSILLVFKKRKVVISIEKAKNNIYYVGGVSPQVLLPKGEKAVVIATCYKKGTAYVAENIFFVMQEITLGKDEMITLSPKAVKSIDEPMNKIKKAFGLKN